MKDFIKYLSICERYSRVYLDHQLKKYDLNTSHYFYIVRICEEAGITQDRLSQIVHVNPSNVTRALQLLQKQGYIYRKEHEQDKRTTQLYPTDKALNIVNDLKKIQYDYTTRLFENMDEKTKELFSEQLKMLALEAIHLSREVE